MAAQFWGLPHYHNYKCGHSAQHLFIAHVGGVSYPFWVMSAGNFHWMEGITLKLYLQYSGKTFYCFPTASLIVNLVENSAVNCKWLAFFS